MSDLSLEEQAWKDFGDLSNDDAAYLRSRDQKKILVTPRFGSPGYSVNMGPWVGVLGLPSGRTLRVRPKVPVRNIFYMLAKVRDIQWDEDVAIYNSFEEALEFLAEYFADLVEGLISRGLYRHYLEVEDNLAVVRGRIVFADDLRRNLIQRQRSYCRFTEFSWDIPENQVLRQVVHHLTGWGFRPALTSRLSTLDAQLHEVSPVLFSADVIDQFSYHRLNDHYRSPHLLARLFLEGAGITDETGEHDFRTFLVNMNWLFEEFVRTVLGEQLGNYKIERHLPLRLDRAGKVSVYPDIAVMEANEVRLIADCKYQVATEDPSEGHLYQVLSYCTISGVTRGMLIYPLHATEVRDLVEIVKSPIGIQRAVINLNLPPEELEDECRGLADLVTSAIVGTAAGGSATIHERYGRLLVC